MLLKLGKIRKKVAAGIVGGIALILAGSWMLTHTYSIPVLTLESYFGNPEAQYQLGYAYLSGCLEPCYVQDLEEVHKQNGIDVSGHTVKQDRDTAMKWLLRAARAGYTNPQFDYGMMRLNVDDKDAAYWLGQAAEGGDSRAQRQLSLMYAQGQGVPQDYVRAYTWVLIATKGQGETSAQSQSAPFISKMTQDDIQAAKSRAKSWQPTKAPPAPKKPPFPPFTSVCAPPYFVPDTDHGGCFY